MQENKNREILSFIERTLFWDGSLKIKYVAEKFSLTIKTVNEIFSEYLSLAANNINPDISTKKILIPNDKKFKFIFPENNFNNILKTCEAEHLPFVEQLPAIHSAYDKDILRELLRALSRRDKILTIRYQSLNSEIPEERKIIPYKISYIRNRYHVRAFCLKQQGFRDFVLSRIVTVSYVSDYKEKPPHDKESFEDVNVIIKPHSKLSPMQKMCTEIEYGMENQRRTFIVKKSMLIYLLDELRVGKDYYEPPFTVLELENIADIKNIFQNDFISCDRKY